MYKIGEYPGSEQEKKDLQAAKNKLQKVLAGKKVICCGAEIDYWIKIDERAYKIRTDFNPMQVGTKDTYIAYL